MPSSSEITVREVRIRLQRSGHGERILFLHGAGGVMTWLPFFDAVAADRELIVPDHPGFGRSDDPVWIRNIPDVAMFYLDFLKQLELRDVHLVGHSLGGWIAAELTVRDCSRLRSLTLIAPAGIRVKGVPRGDPFLWSQEEHVRNLYFDQSFAERQLAIVPSEADTDILLRNRYTFAKLAWQPRLFDPNLEKWLHRIVIPAHLIWGDSDKLLPIAYAERWRERLPRCQMTVIPQCGHLPQIEKSEELAQHIKRFLGEVRS